MKRGTVIVAFGMTAVALGLVVWMTLVGGAQTSGPGLVVQGAEANLPVVTLVKGDTLAIYGINKTTVGQAMDFHVTVRSKDGSVVKDDTCQASSQAFCSVQTDCGKTRCELRANIIAICTSPPAQTDGGTTTTTCRWSTNAAVVYDNGVKMVTPAMPDFEESSL